MNSITTRFSNKQPCPVCGAGTKGCSATAGGLHFCRGTPRDGWRDVGRDDNGFGHYRPTEAIPAVAPRNFRTADATDWAALAAEFVRRLPASAPARLAESLGLPVDALDGFSLGVRADGDNGTEFTIPERNGREQIVGIATRLERPDRAADKKCLPRSKRELTIRDGWREVPGPLFLVEGFTDTAAMHAAGLNAVGRANNLHGADLLAELFSAWPADTGVIVLGENDPNGAGLTGAVRLAEKLTAALGRPVPYALPPAGAKDARAWLTAEERGGMTWPERGAAFRKLVEADVKHPDGPAVEPVGGERPEIVISTDEYRVNEEAIAALRRAANVYQRGGSLVQVVGQDEEPEAEAVVRRPVGSPVVRELPKPTLRELLTRCGRWVEWRGKGEALRCVPTHPPDWSVNAVYARGDWPGVRPLEAVVTHPVLLADGSILARNGYHPASGLLLTMPPDLTPAVPDRPTRDDVAAAVGVLAEVVADFPFDVPAHRAAWVAGLLTPLAWFSFRGPAPLFLIDANVRAAGKGLLADTAALILTGRRFPVMNYTPDREELRKRITSLAVAGERLVLLDNLAGTVGNDVLDMALTAELWKDRLLGGNRVYHGPLNLSWWATGNNVLIVADTARRVCHIRLESDRERPEERDDVRHKNLRSYVHAERGRLMSAALTILRGWVVAGRPVHGLKPWGSFEAWSAVVREAVAFAGLPDPGETRLQLQTMADRDANAMDAVLRGVRDMDPTGRGLTTAEIVNRLKDGNDAADRYADLRSGVEELCGKLCGKRLGYKFREFCRRNIGGWMLDKAGSPQGKNRWAVIPAGTRRGPANATHPIHPTDRPSAA